MKKKYSNDFGEFVKEIANDDDAHPVDLLQIYIAPKYFLIKLILSWKR